MQRAVLLAGASLAWAAPTVAQVQSTPISLGTAEASVEEPFSQIRGLRELADGRVLVVDVKENVVSRVDFKTGTASQVGRTGSGPGEYQRPFGLYALPGDTTLVYDLGNQRFVPILPDGKLGNPFRQESSGTGGVQVFRLPDAVDARGRFYYADATRVGPDGRMERADSAAIYRVDRRSGKTDTLAKVGMPRSSAANNASTGGVRMNFSRAVPFAPQDAWGVAEDGRVAVARAGDNHVEWWGDKGRLAAGPPVPYTPVRVTARDKEAAEQQASQGTMVMTTTGGAGGGARTMTPPPLGDIDWPDTKPPFVARGARVAPDGHFWVERSGAATDKSVIYDVYDAEGRRVKAVQLPPDRRLIGFGKTSLYLARVDQDDLQWLERYRRP